MLETFEKHWPRSINRDEEQVQNKFNVPVLSKTILALTKFTELCRMVKNQNLRNLWGEEWSCLILIYFYLEIRR